MRSLVLAVLARNIKLVNLLIPKPRIKQNPKDGIYKNLSAKTAPWGSIFKTGKSERKNQAMLKARILFLNILIERIVKKKIEYNRR